MKKNLKNLIFYFSLIFFATSFSIGTVFAVSATLYGEVTDDGGDPNLYVWFQYGKTTSYGYETPKQTKYGTGEFSATVSNLENCTTYHYRAVVRHQNYDDTTYGEDKVFNTPCEKMWVDLKANGSDGPITVLYGESVKLKWTSQNVRSCSASDGWSGEKPTSGSEIIDDLTSSKTFTIVCYGDQGSVSDSVKVKVKKVAGETLPTISKTVRNVSDGNYFFSDTVYADPSEVLEFKIVIKSGSRIENAKIKDILPEKIYIRSNTLKIDGNYSQGDITSGISLGDLSEGETLTITFLADLAKADNFSFGTTKLTNTATLYWNGDSVSDSVEINVNKTQVLGAATGAPTGWDGRSIFWFSFLLIFFLSLSIIFFPHFQFFRDIFEKRKLELREAISERAFRIKIKRMKK